MDMVVSKLGEIGMRLAGWNPENEKLELLMCNGASENEFREVNISDLFTNVKYASLAFNMGCVNFLRLCNPEILQTLKNMNYRYRFGSPEIPGMIHRENYFPVFLCNNHWFTRRKLDYEDVIWLTDTFGTISFCNYYGESLTESDSKINPVFRVEFPFFDLIVNNSKEPIKILDFLKRNYNIRNLLQNVWFYPRSDQKRLDVESEEKTYRITEELVEWIFRENLGDFFREKIIRYVRDFPEGMERIRQML